MILLVGIGAVTLRDDKPCQNGLGALLSRKRGKREADVVPVDRLMDKVTQEITVQGGVQQSMPQRGACLLRSHDLPRKSHGWAPRPEVLNSSLTQSAQWARPVR